MLKSLLFILTIIFFSACSSKKVEPTLIVPQEPESYTKNFRYNFDNITQKRKYREYITRYFRPWKLKRISTTIKEANWGIMYKNKNVFGNNLLKIENSWFDKQVENANYKKISTFMQKAITIRNSDLKIFPTIDKIFLNPNKFAEGFPFDYNQSSGVKINTPLMISHLSKDKQWAFIETSRSSGWVLVNDLAYVSSDLTKKFQTFSYFTAIKDTFPIYKKDMFIENIKIGTIFPFVINKHGQKNFLTVRRKENTLEGTISYVKLTKKQASLMPISFNRENINNITNELLNQPYGWGELLSNRDCSSMTRDFFTPFGIFLHRNSKSQTKNGKFINLKEMSNKEKKDLIMVSGIPFLTLLYKKGHIMIYLGHKQNQPIIFHNLWSIKWLNEEGEKQKTIIGKSVITSLEPLKITSEYENENSLLKTISGLVFLN